MAESFKLGNFHQLLPVLRDDSLEIGMDRSTGLPNGRRKNDKEKARRHTTGKEGDKRRRWPNEGSGA